MLSFKHVSGNGHVGLCSWVTNCLQVWELEPGELEEQRSLAAGGYVAVRRVVRLLEEGEAAKQAVDTIINAASDLINLRVAIMK